MRTLRSMLLVLVCLVMVVLCACPAPVGPDGTTTSTTSGTLSGSSDGNDGPTVPTGAVFRPSDTDERAAYWKKLSAPTGSFAATAYTNAAEGAFPPQQVIPAAGTDAAFSFTAPYDGIYEIGADLLFSTVDASVTLNVYKGAARIWPVTEDAYTVTTDGGTDRFTATTAAKKGDVLYIRASGSGAISLTPRVTLLSGSYTESRDLEKNFPTVGILSDVGSSVKDGDLVMQPISIPSGAQEHTYGAAKIANYILTGREEVKQNKVYYVENDADLTLDFAGRNAYTYSCDGMGVCVVTGGKVIIKNLGVLLFNITFIADGGVYIQSSESGKLMGVAIDGGLVIEESASCIDLESCRIEAGGTALENHGYATGATGSYFEGGSAALVDLSETGEGLYYDCVMHAPSTAILLAASSTTVRSCTVYGDIRSDENVENLLVAKCDVRSVGAIVYNKVHNSVVLFNEVENVIAKNSTNVYVCENAIYGGLLFDNIRYMIAEDNTLATATPALVSVRDYNGDNVTDVTARAENGVNEALLPHVNRDNHVNMTRKTYVRNEERKNQIIGDYINANMKDDTDVIIAPGAYNSGNTVVKLENLENANLYAYGVLFERTVLYGAGLLITSCENIGIYGLTISMNVQSSGQLQILEKLPDNKALCVVGAGIRPTWNKSHEIGYRENSLSSYGDLHINGTPSFDSSSKLATIEFDSLVYESIEVGDVITCRIGDSLTTFSYSKGIFLEDVTVMGGAIRCFWDDYNEEGTTINRALDTRMPAKVIDESTYNLYKQYEQQYGVNTGVYIDEYGNYRGAESRSATADFAHANSSRSGFTVTNSIVDGLTDDGTNNQGHKSRVYGYDIETGKVLIKGDATWGYGESISSAMMSGKKGDTVKIYTISGQMLVNEELLSGVSISTVGTRKYGYFYIEPGNEALADMLASIDAESDNSSDFKILCECAETNSPNATFDNVLFKNIRSRACLIKGDGARIENCSFINIGMAAIALNYEPCYGESGFPSDAVIRNNYFEGTGNYENKKYYSPISVDAPALQGGEDYMTSYNLLIEGNVFRDRYTSHALYVSGSANVTVKNNDFGDHIDYLEACAVYMDFVRDVEFSGNTYTAVYENTFAAQVVLSNYVNVHGDDLDGTHSDRLVTDATFTTVWAENIPYLAGDTLVYKGNWDAGYLSAETLNYKNYKSYSKVLSAGPMFFTSGDPWSSTSTGAVCSISRDYRFVTSSKNNVAIRYTMDKDATVAFSISEFFPPYPSTMGYGAGDACFAIFVNNEMVWPYQGGEYIADYDWYYITHDTSVAEINKSLAELTLDLQAGDQIFFMAKMPYGGEQSFFAAAPSIYYLS